MEGECLYHILNVDRSATDDDIKKAYRAAALSSHPDKNPSREAEAAEHFKKVQHAYSVLSDPHERAWYDGHRTQILRSGNTFNSGDASDNAEAADATLVDLFACFSATAFSGFSDDGDGFYAFYGRVFDELWQEEVEAMGRKDKLAEVGASFGGSEADWETVKLFYAFWESFASAKTFAYADKWNMAEAPNREIRRLMERENRRERAKLRKEFNTTVRELVAFIRKRDPRVGRRRRAEEAERAKREEERVQKKKEQIRVRSENFKETKMLREQALEEDAEGLDEILRSIRIDEQMERRKGKRKGKDEGSDEDIVEEDKRTSADESIAEVVDGKGEDQTDETVVENDDHTESDSLEEGALYCAACRKPFRTIAQKADHERSKKHKSAVATLRKQLLSEDKQFDEIRSSVGEGKSIGEDEVDQTEENGFSDEELEGLEEENSAMALGGPSSKSKKKKKQRLKHTGRELDQLSSEEVDLKASEKQLQSGNTAEKNNESTTRSSTQSRPEAEGVNTECSDPTSSQMELSKKQKRKLREQKKKERDIAPSKATLLSCNVCKAPFPTRNKLMRHVESSGHALYLPRPNASSRRK